MKTYGTVIDVCKKTKINCEEKIKIQLSKSCAQCASKCTGCSKPQVIETANTINAKKGQVVEIEMSDKNFLKTSAIIYVFPIVMLFIGFFSGHYFFHHEGLSALSGVIFLILSFVIVKAMDKIFLSNIGKIIVRKHCEQGGAENGRR